MYIQDPLHGGFRINDKKIIDMLSTFEISRLSSIKQANLTSLVFPGANHTRFEHTMGTVFLMDKVFESLKNKESSAKERKNLEEDAHLMRLVALLHDMCSFPFSHVIESNFKQIPETEEFKNRDDLYAFDDFFGNEKCFLNELNHEWIRNEILEGNINIEGYYKKWYGDFHIDKTVTKVLDKDARQSIVNVYKGKDSLPKEKQYLTDLIDSDIDIDRVDHLMRDSYYSGIKHADMNAMILINSLSIQGGDLTIDSREGLPQAVHLMAARELLYDSYYNHQATRCYEAMMARAIYKLLVVDKNLDIDQIIFLTDDLCMYKLLNIAWKNRKRQRDYSFNLLRRVSHRNPLELIFEVIWPDICISDISTPTSDVDKLFGSLKHLNKVIKIEEEIAAEIGIRPDEILIHRDHISDDPRKVTTLPDVPINIYSKYMKRKSKGKEIYHYHSWLKGLKEDWKERWSVRVYTGRPEKKKQILDAISKKVPLIGRFIK